MERIGAGGEKRERIGKERGRKETVVCLVKEMNEKRKRKVKEEKEK